MKQYAEDVKELAIHLRWTDFYVAGHSGGGPHALALASYLGPDIVKGGVLAAPAPPLVVAVRRGRLFSTPLSRPRVNDTYRTIA